MRIAFFTETYLPNRDGVVNAILNFRKELERRGHDVYIFTAGSRKAKAENKDERVFFHTSIPFNPYPQYKIALFPFLSHKKLRELDIQIVHSHGIASMGLAAINAAHSEKLPLIGSFHTMIPVATHYISRRSVVQSAASRIAWSYLKWYFNHCDVTTAPTLAIRHLLEKRGFKNIYIVPNGIDTYRFHTRLNGHIIRKRLGLEKNQVVLHLGRLVLEKNLDVLIDATLVVLEEMPDVKFLIAGDGPAKGYYTRRVREEGLEKAFVFHGFIPEEEVPLFYAASDIFVIPSKFETQSLVLLEAMACGKPVAAADFLAMSEMVKEGFNGYLFNPDSPDECAEKIIKTLRDKKKLKENARLTAEAYSTESCTERLISLYEKFA